MILPAPEHELLRNDLAAYALGSLAPDEAARVERHLAACAECRALLREYEAVLRLLPVGLTPAEPSPGARAALLARIRAEVAQRNGESLRSRQRWRRVRKPALLVAAAGVILGVVLAGVLLAGVLLDRSSSDDAAGIVADMRADPDTRVIPMHGSENAPSATGQLIVHPGQEQAGLVVHGLARLPDDRSYQLWYVRPDQSRVSGGVFNTDRHGEATILVSSPADFSSSWRCGVTEEPAGGSPGPTGRNVMTGQYDESW
jgi:anti-sigma-K factor RskA